MSLVTIVLPLVPLGFGIALLRAAGGWRLRGTARSRAALVRLALEATAVLVLVRGLVAWGETPAWLWWPSALLVAAGLAAAAARLAHLPALDPDRPARRQIAAVAVDGAVSIGLVALLLV